MRYRDHQSTNWKWPRRMLELARHVSTWSKDPSTKCGAVIYEETTNNVVALGYNGFPRNVVDDEVLLNSREEKYRRIIHAEVNAILRLPTISPATLVMAVYPLPPCEQCALMIIQGGIKGLVTQGISVVPERWHDSCVRSKRLLESAGVFIIREEVLPNV